MKFGPVLFILFLLAGCGNKKNSGNGDAVMEVTEFFRIFKPVKLPYTITDTSFTKLTKDTTINADLLSQFVADTVVTNLFGTVKPRITPAGRVSAKKAETYLFVKATSGSKKVAYLLVFDRENKFRAGLPLIVSDNDPQTSQTATMDNRYTISINSQRKKPNGELGYKKDAFVYNNIGVFTLILTETNEDLTVKGEVINPLDTLPKKNKLSGDYVLDKKNFISFRDGRRNSELRFFVHFEKDKGSCKGELRGEVSLTTPDVAVYRESGDPCVLEFNFTPKSVSMKEVQGCGNYRDIKCFFEGTYVRKKEKPKPTKKK